MGIPLVALGVRPPQIRDYGEQQLLNNQNARLQGENALLPGQLQQQQLQQQLGQSELARQKDALETQQALDQAYKSAVRPNDQGQPEIDTDSLTKALASAGHGSAVPSILEGVAKYQQTKNALLEQVQKIQSGQADMMGYAAAAVKNANYDPRLSHVILDTLPHSPQIDQMRQLIDGDPATFKQQVDAAYAQSPAQQKLANEQKVAEIRSEKNPTEASLAVAAAQGDPDAQKALDTLKASTGTLDSRAYSEWKAKPQNASKSIQDFQTEQELRKQQTLLPGDIRKISAEAQARQAAAQGDPREAGSLLANGSLTLADLKSRGTTPKFIAQSVQEAQKIKPNYNPADEVIAESVAKSQTANQFFGSANSLIAKGGTLDQLETLGKQIPQNKLPILNTVEDWQKLASGKGPLAGYAAVALGAADDYGKVMGGGTASDHARDAALQLFAKAASPEQRAAAVSATRNAVQSQRDSRIGNNQFLKRQYGAEVSKGETGYTPPVGAKTATGPNGHKINVDGGKWVDSVTGKPI